MQEALTNAIKHAGPARAQVNARFAAHELDLQVLDSGPARVREREDGGESGHGLIGMRERVALYGGELRAGPRPGGGFEVRARTPIDGIGSPPRALASPSSVTPGPVAVADGVRWHWLDPVLAGSLLVVLEIGVLSTSHRRGPLALNMIVVAGMALAAIWRRRSPLLFLVAVGVLGAVMDNALTSLNDSPLAGAYFVLVPTYTVAAWEDRRKAVLGLAIFVGGTAVGELIVHHGQIGNFAGAIFTMSAAWAAGVAIRGRRMLISELQRTSARLAAEREDRARLAVAGERSRIARELHAIVARSVAAMVVQAEAGGGLLDGDPAHADAAMGAIEDTGRQALAEMRRILGVLRHAEATGELEPQPGVDQIYTLIQRAREAGQPVELSVAGEPGTVPAGVDLGIYRILEEALQSAGQQPGSAVGVALRFGKDDLELHLTASCRGPSGWPTDAMRERLALCGGELNTTAHGEDGWQFAAQMPRGLRGALAAG